MDRILSILCFLSCLCLFGYGEPVGQLSSYLAARYAAIRQGKTDTTGAASETTVSQSNYGGGQGVTVPNACICSAIYDPVCGSDDKSYYNLCQLQCAPAGNVSAVHQGNCIPF